MRAAIVAAGANLPNDMNLWSPKRAARERGRVIGGKADLKSTFAKVSVERENAHSAYEKLKKRCAGMKAGEKRDEVLAKLNAAYARLETINDHLEQIRAAELERYPQLFQKPAYEKVRLLVLGWMQGGPNPEQITLHFPNEGSFLQYECRWALAEMVRQLDPKTCQLVSSLLVPDGKNPLAHVSLNLRLGQRKAGAITVPYVREMIIAAVETFKNEGLGADAAVSEAADWYNVSMEYVYRCLRR